MLPLGKRETVHVAFSLACCCRLKLHCPCCLLTGPLLQAQAALLHAVVKLRPGAGIHHLYQQLEDLKAAKPSLAALKPLWLTITAAATAAGPQAAESAKAFVQEWMVEADLYTAELAADVVGVDVLHLQHVGQSMQVR